MGEHGSTVGAQVRLRSSPKPSLLRIGDAAIRAGITVSALRYYDSIGLVRAEQRIGNQRYYERTVLRRVALVRAAREAGLRLSEIRALIDGPQAGASIREQWRALARRRLDELDRLIERLDALRVVLVGCLECGCLSPANCRLLSDVGDLRQPRAKDAPDVGGQEASQD